MRHLRCTNAHPQERRAPARRGTGKRVCNGDRLFRAQRVPPDTIAFHPTAGLRQPLLVASADAVADVRFVSASPLPTPRLAYTSRSWLPARMLLLTCVSYPQVRYPHQGWLTPAALGCATFSGSIAGLTPPVTKLPEPFFHPNRIKTTTLYPTGRGAARTYSEKQSHLRGSRLRVSSGVAESLERKRRSEQPDGGSSR
jgi:hypothetical protein